MIKEAREEGISLKQIQVEWERVKRGVEEWFANIKNDERYQTGLTEEEKKEGEKMGRELIQAVEVELYPERENQGSNKIGWIVGGGIIVVVIGSVVCFLYKNRKK